MYGDSYFKDKPIVRPSYLKHGDPYTGKTTFSYWYDPRTLRRQAFDRPHIDLLSTDLDFMLERGVSHLFHIVCQYRSTNVDGYMGDSISFWPTTYFHIENKSLA